MAKVTLRRRRGDSLLKENDKLHAEVAGLNIQIEEYVEERQVHLRKAIAMDLQAKDYRRLAERVFGTECKCTGLLPCIHKDAERLMSMKGMGVIQ